jgi:CBS domain-containing protein
MPANLDIFVVHTDSTIKEVSNVIALNYSRCAIVTQMNGKVVGVVSEGDIIRSLLEDVSLYTPIGKIVRPSFRYLRERDVQKALELLRSIGITLLPIVDEEFVLQDVITVHDILGCACLDNE